MDIKKYNLPLTCVTILGSKARVTPGLVALFSGELAKRRINIHAMSSGENSLSFYIDGDRGAEAVKALQPDVLKKSAFQGISLRKEIGMISVTGEEFVNTPGMFARVITPLGENGINILCVSTSFDSVLLFLDMQDVALAFRILGGSFEEEKPQPAFTLEQLEEEAAAKKEEEERERFAYVPKQKEAKASAKQGKIAKGKPPAKGKTAPKAKAKPTAKAKKSAPKPAKRAALKSAVKLFAKKAVAKAAKAAKAKAKKVSRQKKKPQKRRK